MDGTEIFQAIVRPDGMVDPDEERTIGYFSTRTEANNRAIRWMADSRPPHGANDCGCRWESVIVPITIGEVAKLWD
jgi:hypothetical protein